MTKRIVCLALALIMLLVTFVACQKDNGDGQESQSAPTTNNDVVDSGSGDDTNNESGEATLELPEKNWNNRDFTMLVRQARIDQFGEGEIEFGSSQLDKAIYERNQKVETEYGVNITYLTVPDTGSDGVKGSDMMLKLDASSLANCPDYDAVAPDYYWGCETKGYFANLLNLDYLNFDAPWWWSNWNDTYTLDDKLTTAVGWLTLDIVQGMEVVYFNTQIMEETTDEDVYQLVYDKEWTLDKMIQISKDATYNVVWSGAVGETGSQGEDYVHGTLLHYMGLRSLFFSLGGRFASFEDDGSVTYSFSTNSNQQIADTLSEWIVGNPEVFFASYNKTYGHGLGINERPTTTAEYFAGNHALFYCYGIKTAELLASLDMEFGILPPPAAEEGEEYVTTTFGTSYFAIERGRTEEQQAFAAFVLEALNYYSYTMVKDVYYEKTLKLQYGGTDRQAKDMIDMVVERAYLDFAYICGAGDLMGKALTCIMEEQSLSSVWIKNETAVTTALADYLNGYLK